MDYQKGAKVEVDFFGEWLPGIIREVFPNYGFQGNQEVKYEIHGTGKSYITIVSQRLIRDLTASQQSVASDASRA